MVNELDIDELKKIRHFNVIDNYISKIGTGKGTMVIFGAGHVGIGLANIIKKNII
ncbi:hypothetical protein K8O96_15040 [Clostridium sporogenes]|uniref:hypothetical protein n=1 Tax=Clostridium caseinilyticum TaxID=3350403 RepID=UPI0013D8070A|nr:hypothetical protein [Clostridium sporogenes]UAL59377.1 hypothetical protein K8O96_15040 [Clostridium sporogenes]